MPKPTQPLRTALIGLSSSAITAWASAAHLPGLLSPTGRTKFTITALLNSGVEAAQSAVKKYDLPPSTKTYGSASALAKDRDIDLVICNTRVDKHYETILPSVKAGKDVYVEWPVAANASQISEIVEEARKSGSRVAVGLQRRWAPQIVKLREIVRGGRLGKVLSADVRAFGGTNDREIYPTGLKYFTERAVGGNVITIGFAHVFDAALSAIGELERDSVSTKLQLQRLDVRFRNPASGEIVETARSEVPDLLVLHGTLQKSPHIAPDATLSFLFRRGQPFPGNPALTTTVNFEKGEVRFISPSGLNLNTGHEGGVSIQIHHYDSDKVEDVEWGWTSSEEEEGLSETAKVVQRSLFAFADGKEAGDGWLGLEEAAQRAEQIGGFLEGWVKRQA